MKKHKSFIIFIIIVPIILYGAFFITERWGTRYPSSSVLNKSYTGCSIFFEVLKELEYPVGRTEKPIESYPKNVVQIKVVNTYGGIGINETDDADKWIENGGILVYLIPGNIFFNLDDLAVEKTGMVDVYKFGDGHIITADLNYFTNSGLIDNQANAYSLLEILDEFEFSKIYFNEANLFAALSKHTLWDTIPLEIKFILYQILISLMAYFYYKGKRFGKPLPYYEEEERLENEYLYSAAALYREAGCWDLMIENYYKDFLKELGQSEDEWLKFWKRECFPSQK
ncbi:MAG: hypothetical protein ACOC1O_04585, partial [bacterium]